MGVAAYNRGTKAIRDDISRDGRPAEFWMMDSLNSMPKYEDAGRPFGSILFKYDGKRWWAVDPVKQFAGRGYWYESLREAVKRWDVEITEYRDGDWFAIVRAD